MDYLLAKEDLAVIITALGNYYMDIRNERDTSMVKRSQQAMQVRKMFAEMDRQLDGGYKLMRIEVR